MTSFGAANSRFRAPETHRSGRGAVVAAGLLVLQLAVAGCGAGASAGDRSGPPTVLTTLTIVADMARQVGGEHVRVESLTGPGVDVHGYEPTSGDLRRAYDADLIVEHGLGIDAWLLDLVAEADTPRVVATRDVEPMKIVIRDGEEIEDPHAWMSPANALLYVDVLEKEIAKLVPDRADEIEASSDAYRKVLRELGRTVASAFSKVPKARRILVSCEGAFGYLAREAGLEVRYLWPINSEQQVTPARLATVIEEVGRRQVPAVFCESTVSADLQQRVAGATSAEYGGTLYVDSLSQPDGPVPTYERLIRYDLELIAAGLGGDLS
jgi:manganese transport system substrate-binding protein